MSAAPAASMTSVDAPPTARICVGSTAGSHAGPKIHGTAVGARIASRHNKGNRRAVMSRTIRLCSSERSSALPARASTGKPTCPMTRLIFFWYSTASMYARK